MTAFMRGIAIAMIKNAIATLTGNIQIHHKGYRNDPVVENSMPDMAEIQPVLEKNLPPAAKWTSRVRVNAIANNARHSAGVTLVGIDPVREAGISFIGRAVKQGRYLKPEDKNGIIIGKALADKFETKPGYKIILMSQDRSREIASRAFRIVGIFQAELEATEKQYAFITKSAAQEMLKMGQAISEISIILPEYKGGEDGKIVAGNLRASLSAAGYDVHTWQELLPLLAGYKEFQDQFLIIWYIVIFIAMSFGIVNTMLMAIFERMKEFGLLKALGLKPWGIVRDVLAESLFLLLMGMTAGTLLALLCVWALADKGIDFSAFAAGTEYFGMSRIVYPIILVNDVITANTVVLVLGLLVSLYPAAKAARFTPVEALTHT